MTKYLVWRPENGQGPDDGTVVYANDANAAACKWAEWCDAYGAEYRIVGGADATVMVRAVNKPADQYEMIVSGKSVPIYSARVAVKHPDMQLIEAGARHAEMLKALRQAVVLLAGACVHSPELEPNATYEAVSAAIAKATGCAG